MYALTALAVMLVAPLHIAPAAHHPAATHSPRPAAVHSAVVHRGDTLSGIAIRDCAGKANDWTGIFEANRRQITNPNVIYPGQRLTIRCTDPAWLLKLAAPVPAPAPPTPVGTSSPTSNASAGSVGSTAQTYTGSGSMQQCIIARESGGNSQVMNATGHYGLYQFSYSTWTAHGGNPADFGHASVAEQNQVYYNAVAADGYSDWAAYDGC